MTRTLTGGCLCGAIRYAYDGAIGPANYCHCSDCRKRTGSAFNIGVRIDALHFRIVTGQPKGFAKTADSGHELTRYFCAECGSPLYTASPRHPAHIFITAGCIDDPSAVQPKHQGWVTSRVSWATIDPALPFYPKGRG